MEFQLGQSQMTITFINATTTWTNHEVLGSNLVQSTVVGETCFGNSPFCLNIILLFTMVHTQFVIAAHQFTLFAQPVLKLNENIQIYNHKAHI